MVDFQAGTALLTACCARNRVTDVAGKIRRVTDPNTNGTIAGTTNYTFDPFGNLITIVDADNYSSSATYNIRGFKTGSNDVDAGSWTFTPDSLNELVSQTDAKRQVTTFGYDLLGRMASRTEPESTTATQWTYGTSATAHNIGRVVQATKPDGYAEAYTYDHPGRRLDQLLLLQPAESHQQRRELDAVLL